MIFKHRVLIYYSFCEFKVAIAFYLGFAIFFVGVLMSFAFEGTAPKLPQKPLPWIGAIFVACLGILQQFCLIGKYK